jgi:hypothetical protein
MSTLNCPICATAPLGVPYRFAGQWLAACARCHAEIEVREVETAGAGVFKLDNTLKLATLREAEQYRRRTSF